MRLFTLTQSTHEHGPTAEQENKAAGFSVLKKCEKKT